MGHIERTKRDSGIKDREERSSGIEILISDDFVKIKPTDPLRLPKQISRRKRNWSDSSSSSLTENLVKTHLQYVKDSYYSTNLVLERERGRK